MSRRLLTCGEHAVLVELDGLDEVLALADAVRAAVGNGDAAFADMVDLVPAARTLLLVVGDGADVAPVRQALQTLAPLTMSPTDSQAPPVGAPVGATVGGPLRAPVGTPAGELARTHAHPTATRPHIVEIRVHYDGPDLDEVSKLTGLTPDEVVAAHTQTPWRVAFSGFSPGFAYLSGGDGRLQVPRRSEPRTSVPSGAVGLAGEFSAVYPRSSPGGWQLLGHTDEILWDVDRQPPALLQPGSVVRFINAGDTDTVDADHGPASR
jgi:KipI family sensor histidine kinase inhibitor